MNVSSNLIQQAHFAWESELSSQKHFAYLRVFHPTDPEFRFRYFADSSIPDFSSISFSVDEIRQLAVQFSYPEGFLNYLQRFHPEPTIKTLAFSGSYPNGMILTCLETTRLDLFLLMELIQTWLESTNSSSFPFQWSFNRLNLPAIQLHLHPDKNTITGSFDLPGNANLKMLLEPETCIDDTSFLNVKTIIWQPGIKEYLRQGALY